MTTPASAPGLPAGLPTAQDVLHFWFQQAGPQRWFDADAGFDAHIRLRFGATHAAAVHGELAAWRDRPEGRVAEVIVLDQFSRNLYRNQAAAFAADAQALALAQEAVRCGDDQRVSPLLRGFLYMPYMHSESRLIHEEAWRLYSQPGLEDRLHPERWHKDIIDRFGRYPHRNVVLGRASTPEEQAYLERANLPF